MQKHPGKPVNRQRGLSDLIIEPNESIVLEISPQTDSGATGSIIVFIILGLLFPPLWIVAIVLYRSSRKSIGKYEYVLTNKRALVVDPKKPRAIVTSCDLADVDAMVQNRHNSLAEDNSGLGYDDRGWKADIVFFQGNILRQKFEDVGDPDGIVNTINQIKRSV